jgi:DNA-binding transcriptional MerR regulator
VTGKDPEAFLTIGELSARLGIKTHILRYWEEQFPMLTPLKRAGGRRLYRPADVVLIEQIQDLLDRQGYTIRGAVHFLQGGGTAGAGRDALSYATSNAASISSDHAIDPAALLSIRNRLAAALAAA